MSEQADDWREIYRPSDAPAPAVGSLIEGLERDGNGNWQGIAAPVESVELVETNDDGSRVFKVRLGASVIIKDGDTRCQ